MDAKPRVLVLSANYLPGFRGGGPARSLVNLVTALRPEMDFRIITLDRDVGGGPPYPSVRSGSWQSVEGATVLYLAPAAVSVSRLVREVAAVSPSLVYLNSFFDPVFTLRILTARRAALLPRLPILLAPRGELAAGALGLKRLKKAAWIRVAGALGFYDRLHWQASGEMEAQQIKAFLGDQSRAEIHIAPNLTDDGAGPPARRAGPRSRGVLRLCFLARISPMKNLAFALRVLAQVRTPVEFAIYGPIEDVSYWAACERLIAQLPAHIQASYLREVPPQDVSRTLAGYDFLLLPTRGESFGHVIHEALSAGVPVMISDQTPWQDLEQHGVGWSLPLDAPSDFVRVIEEATGIADDQYQSMAGKAAAFARTRSDRAEVIGRTSELFHRLIAR